MQQSATTMPLGVVVERRRSRSPWQEWSWRPVAVILGAPPLEAEGYLSGGDEIVEGVPMPGPVIAWLEDFVARHHVERPFVKRKRKRGATVAGDERPGGGPRGDGHG